MTTARARRYPQPSPVAEVLAAERCEHGEITGRCALCRQAAEPGDDQTPPRPTRRRPARRRAADDGDQADTDPPAEQPPTTTARPAPAPVVDEDDQDPRSIPWWDR